MTEVKLTKQGVRDLGKTEALPPKVAASVRARLNECAHAMMSECCKPGPSGHGCGHWECPECGLTFDEDAGR